MVVLFLRFNIDDIAEYWEQKDLEKLFHFILMLLALLRHSHYIIFSLPFFSTFFIQCYKIICGKIITTNIEFIIDPKLGLNTSSFFIEWLNRVHAEKSGFSGKKKIYCMQGALSFILFTRYRFLSLFNFITVPFNYPYTQLSLLYFIPLSCSIIKVQQ